MKTTPESGWNLLFAASVVVILLTVGYAAASPIPAEPTSHAAIKKSIADLNRDSMVLEINATAYKSAATSKTWDETAEALGSQALDRINQLAEKNHLILSGFRTEQTLAVAHLSEAPMVVTVDGSFNDVLAFLKSFEADDSKLTVNLFQVTASEQGAARVTATLGVLGFLAKEAK